MSHIVDTELSMSQDARLAGFARDFDPEPKVVGWDERKHGPILVFPDGRVRTLTPNGRLTTSRGW